VRIVRFGFLGPQARSATYVDDHGQLQRVLRLSPQTGGGYLFVVAAAPAPFRRSDAASPPPPTLDSVSARFANGRVIRVAGHGREHLPLPGIRRRRAPAASTLRAHVTVTPRVAHPQDDLQLRFRAPVAIPNFDAYYKLRIQGPWHAPTCRFHRFGTAFSAVNRDVKQGEVVTYPLTGGGGTTWCRGRFKARITYHSGATGRREPVVGTGTFTVR
jgi:hypothetical protein